MKSPEQVGDQAEDMFSQGFNCCESTATVLAEALGRRCESCLPALATGLGGGMGHTGHVCGALTGGVMAIGLAASLKKLADHAAEKRWANDVTLELFQAFEREFTYVDCRRLINIDLRAPDAMDRYRAEGCKEKCGHFVQFVGEWVARRLAEEGL